MATVKPEARGLKRQRRDGRDGCDQIRSFQGELERHAAACRQPGRVDSRSIERELGPQPLEDVTDVGDVDAFARVLRETALQKATLRHRGPLPRVRRVRQPVSVDDDEPVPVGQRLPSRVRVVEGRRFGARRVAGEHEHHRRGPGRQRRRRVDEITPLHLGGPEPANRRGIGQTLHERRDAAARLLRARRPLQADGRLRAGGEAKSRRRGGRRRAPARPRASPRRRPAGIVMAPIRSSGVSGPSPARRPRRLRRSCCRRPGPCTSRAGRRAANGPGPAGTRVASQRGSGGPAAAGRHPAELADRHVRPSESPSCTIEREDAEADERRQDRRHGRRERDDDRAEGHREHEEGDADDVEQEERRPLGEPLADVLERRRLAGNVGDRVAALPPPSARRRTTSRSTSLSVASSCGADVGVTNTIADRLLSLSCGSRIEATPGRPWT